jgi:hypothetical protein
MTTFPVWKRTATHADTLAAVGLADLLSIAGLEGLIRIREESTRFVVDTESPITEAAVRRIGLDAGYLYLKTKTGKVPESISTGLVLDYEHEKAKAARVREAKAQAKATGGETREAIDA